MFCGMRVAIMYSMKRIWLKWVVRLSPVLISFISILAAFPHFLSEGLCIQMSNPYPFGAITVMSHFGYFNLKTVASEDMFFIGITCLVVKVLNILMFKKLRQRKLLNIHQTSFQNAKVERTLTGTIIILIIPLLLHCFISNFISLLEHDTTNALKKAMNADILKQSRTFGKWSGILDAAMTHFLFLESYLNGLSYHQNMYGPNNLKQKIDRLITKFEYWRDEYKINYWPDTVQQMVYRVQDQNLNCSNEQKAMKLQNLLNQILTDDTFIVIVFDQSEGSDNYPFDCKDNQHVSSFGRAESNVIIYRSKCSYKTGREEFDKLIKEVEDCKTTAIGWTPRISDLAKLIMSNHIQNAGLVGLIEAEKTATILPAPNINSNCSKPGHWIDITIGDSTEKYILIAGFK